ncbi:MAG: polymer-forming cytoskeletal protein [Planctomycetota bacterium]|nr:polymer-forming cytoskeletal protein [Planctomycetota bacterium]
MHSHASQPQRSVSCYHCGHAMKFSPHARSGSCPKCHRRVNLDDIEITTKFWGGAIETCGRIVIRPGARVRARSVRSGDGIRIEGELEGAIVSFGPVVIGPRARWQGELEAPELRIEEGALVGESTLLIRTRDASV